MNLDSKSIGCQIGLKSMITPCPETIPTKTFSSFLPYPSSFPKLYISTITQEPNLQSEI